MVVFISFLTIIAQLFIVVLLWALYTGEQRINVFLKRCSVLLALFVATGTMLGSLYLSEVLGYVPCTLCIYQRFMFSLVPILGTAYWFNYNFKKIIISLSIAGGSIAIYHYYGQMFNISALPCSTTTISCAQRYFVEFGYITIPMMSLTGFALIWALMIFDRRV
jgi:disulfide bond formation protein DsbB